jgi:hypothetical protein
LGNHCYVTFSRATRFYVGNSIPTQQGKYLSYGGIGADVLRIALATGGPARTSSRPPCGTCSATADLPLYHRQGEWPTLLGRGRGAHIDLQPRGDAGPQPSRAALWYANNEWRPATSQHRSYRVASTRSARISRLPSRLIQELRQRIDQRVQHRSAASKLTAPAVESALCAGGAGVARGRGPDPRGRVLVHGLRLAHAPQIPGEVRGPRGGRTAGVITRCITANAGSSA